MKLISYIKDHFCLPLGKKEINFKLDIKTHNNYLFHDAKCSFHINILRIIFFISMNHDSLY